MTSPKNKLQDAIDKIPNKGSRTSLRYPDLTYRARYFLKESPPKLLKEFTKLKSLIIRNYNSLQSLPKADHVWPQLKKLTIRNTGFKNPPREIAKMVNLEELDLSDNYYFEKRFLKEWKWLKPLKKLKKLNLASTLYQTRAIPQSIFELTSLEILDISQANIKKMPPEIVNLQNLKKLTFHPSHIEEFPKELLQLPKLEELTLPDKMLKDLPDYLLDFPEEMLLKSYTKGSKNQRYPHIPELCAIFKKCKDKTQRATYFAILKDSKALENQPLEMLIEILDSGILLLEQKAYNEFERRVRAGIITQQTNPNKGDSFHYKGEFGKAFSKPDLAERLSAQGLSKTTYKKASHIIIGRPFGAHIKMAVKQKKNILTEQLLIDFLNEKEKPYLLEKTEVKHNVDQLRALILSGQGDNIELAMQMLEGGGFPNELLTEMFMVSRERSKYPKASKQAMSFVERYGSLAMREAAKQYYDILFTPSNWSEPRQRLKKNIEYYFRVIPDLDKLKFSKYLLNTRRTGADVMLFSPLVTKEERMAYLEQFKEGTELNLSKLRLSRLPKEILEVKNVKKLSLRENYFPGFPSIIYKLTELEELDFYKGFSYSAGSFKSKLAKMPNLKKVYTDQKRDLPSKAIQKKYGCEFITLP